MGTEVSVKMSEMILCIAGNAFEWYAADWSVDDGGYETVTKHEQGPRTLGPTISRMYTLMWEA
jgi:hypothetical protein